jgi:hypothetical protein
VAAVPGVEPGCGASKAPHLAGGTVARVMETHPLVQPIFDLLVAQWQAAHRAPPVNRATAGLCTAEFAIHRTQPVANPGR